MLLRLKLFKSPEAFPSENILSSQSQVNVFDIQKSPSHMDPVKLQELIASIVMDVYFHGFLQLLAINNNNNTYPWHQIGLQIQVWVGFHTQQLGCQKKQQLQSIWLLCFGSPLFPGTWCVQSSQLNFEIMSAS